MNKLNVTLKKTFDRLISGFLPSILCLIAYFAYSFWNILVCKNNGDIDINSKVTLAIFETYIGVTSVALFFESNPIKNKRLIRPLVEAACVAISWYVAFCMSSSINWMYILGLFLSFTYSPYIFKKNDNNLKFSTFNCGLMINSIIFMAMLLLLALVIFIILIPVLSVLVGFMMNFVNGFLKPFTATPNSLLCFDFMNPLFCALFIIVVIFAPLSLIIVIPSDYEKEYGTNDYYLIMQLLTKYFKIPMLGIMAVTIHIEIIGCIINKTFSSITLEQQIVLYFLSGFATYIVAFPLTKNSSIVTAYTRGFFLTTVIPSIVLFSSVLIRIDQYGYTELRYLEVLFSMFAFFASAYFIAYKKSALIKNIMIAASVVCFISCIGPWNISKVCVESQIEQFKKNLAENGILTENKFHKEVLSNVSKEEKKIIIEQVLYLANREAWQAFFPWLYENINGIFNNIDKSSLKFDKSSLKGVYKTTSIANNILKDMGFKDYEHDPFNPDSCMYSDYND